MRDQELRDQIAALFRCAPGEQRLGDEPPGPIADAVLGVIGPLLAEKDAEARSLAKSWDQRLSDVQAEYVKHLESWDRSRKRLDADRGLLRWLHAEAAWRLDRLHSWAGLMELLDEHWPAEVFKGESEDSDPGPRIVSLIRAVDKVAASRRDWAAEAQRLEDAAEWRRRQLAASLNRHRLTPWDELLAEANRVAELWLDSIAADLDAEEIAKRAEPVPPAPVCACVTEEQAVTMAPGFSRPVCAVHPEEGR